MKPTRFLGYDNLETEAIVEAVSPAESEFSIILDQTPLYAEMGGQVGDARDDRCAASSRHTEAG